jgi:hypothetical protein
MEDDCIVVHAQRNTVNNLRVGRQYAIANERNGFL